MNRICQSIIPVLIAWGLASHVPARDGECSGEIPLEAEYQWCEQNILPEPSRCQQGSNPAEFIDFGLFTQETGALLTVCEREEPPIGECDNIEVVCHKVYIREYIPDARPDMRCLTFSLGCQYHEGTNCRHMMKDIHVADISAPSGRCIVIRNPDSPEDPATRHTRTLDWA